LTIYNQNFAVVRRPLTLDLTAGINEVRVTDITARLEPDSVILRDPQGKRALQILEQNYRADPVSQGLLLSLYEGKEIQFLVKKESGNDEIVRGRIIRSGYERNPVAALSYMYLEQDDPRLPSNQPVIEVNRKLRFSLPGEPLFPALADDAILKPTLHWILQADEPGQLDAEMSYVTGGMSWGADYSVISHGETDRVDIIGWVTIDNQSGTTFENARVKLMAGDVSKVGQGMFGGMGGMGGYGSGETPPVTEKAFEEYHLYTLSRPTTLHDSETKQVEFLRAEGAQSQRIYVYDGARLNPRFARTAAYCGSSRSSQPSAATSPGATKQARLPTWPPVLS